MLENMKAWLQTFPQWEGSTQVDYLEAVPGSTGLYPKGITELSRREDVLGNVKVRCRSTFLLRKTAVGTEENARWLLAFQQWVMEQNRLGLTPKFGDEPKTERLLAADGRLESHAQVGSSLYTVQLQAEFTKIFRGE